MEIRRRRNIIPALIIGIFVAAASISGLVFFVLNRPTNEQHAEENVEEIIPPKIIAAKSKIMLTGTTFWGRRTNRLARNSELGVAYPFSQLSTLEPETYDAWIGNLECPITSNGHTEYNEDVLLKFNCDPDYLPEVKKYFTAFSLGTNHADNWGEEGLIETKQLLAENNMQYFGDTKYNGTDNCNIVVVAAHAEFDNEEQKDISIPLGFCSAHGVFGIPIKEARDNIARYAELVSTIAMPHMGAEYEPSADQLRMNLYREMIDLGVEMVVADHPHWIQNTESYNGKLIAYSLGNFMFDQNFNSEVSRSAALELNLSLENSTDLENLKAWDELGKICLEKYGDCLNDIADSNLPKIDIKWTYDIHGTTSGNDCVTRLADEQGQAAILQRLDWYNTLGGLQK